MTVLKIEIEIQNMKQTKLKSPPPLREGPNENNLAVYLRVAECYLVECSHTLVKLQHDCIDTIEHIFKG